MRTQAVIISQYEDDLPTKLKFGFEGNKDELIIKMQKLQKRSLYAEGKKGKVSTTETREKHKKLGMGLQIFTSDNKTNISHGTFWPISFNKPQHIK